jgi:hypothetical protein
MIRITFIINGLILPEYTSSGTFEYYKDENKTTEIGHCLG